MAGGIAFNDLSRRSARMAAALDAAARRVIARGWYVLGPELDGFEREFAAWCGLGHAVGVASGSDALELALRALGLGPGAVVVTVANAGGYATAAILAVGASPRYVDVAAGTGLLDPATLEPVLAAGPVAALIVPHLYGRLAPMAEILARCRPRGVAVIEDCAQAHGAQRDGRRAGAFGTVGCFSFYPTKNLGALGDGGALVTDDPALAERIRALRQYGWGDKYHVLRPGGRNSRLDEMQAAFLRLGLPRLDDWNHRRRAIAERYRAGIRHPGLACPPPGGADDVAHLFVLRCAGRDRLAAHLAARGIGCAVHYPVPDHRQPGWREACAGAGPLPVTERRAAEILSLPCYPELEDSEVEAVIDAVNGW
ncbi:MAG: aminotransferase [Pseudomonadota bacterium]|jgi:dTDP-4-amino-4,6-dideoxygalactose transaminase